MSAGRGVSGGSPLASEPKKIGSPRNAPLRRARGERVAAPSPPSRVRVVTGTRRGLGGVGGRGGGEGGQAWQARGGGQRCIAGGDAARLSPSRPPPPSPHPVARVRQQAHSWPTGGGDGVGEASSVSPASALWPLPLPSLTCRSCPGRSRWRWPGPWLVCVCAWCACGVSGGGARVGETGAGKKEKIGECGGLFCFFFFSSCRLPAPSPTRLLASGQHDSPPSPLHRRPPPPHFN